MNKTNKTRVIFKKFDEGDIIALFPELAGGMNPYTTCESYMHVGQHGATSVELAGLNPANPEEYASLKAELESLGYDLTIARRMTRKDFLKRKAQVNYA
jgi:hypothetical protein